MNKTYVQRVFQRVEYLEKIDEVRRRGDLVVYTDETWVYEGMVLRRGWVDNTMPRFPAARLVKRYSYGKSAGKNKGKRGIVVAAMCEKGMVPNCTRVFVSGVRTQGNDYHHDMNADVFEKWLIKSAHV